MVMDSERQAPVNSRGMAPPFKRRHALRQAVSYNSLVTLVRSYLEWSCLSLRWRKYHHFFQGDLNILILLPPYSNNPWTTIAVGLEETKIVFIQQKRPGRGGRLRRFSRARFRSILFSPKRSAFCLRCRGWCPNNRRCSGGSVECRSERPFHF